MDYRQIYVDLIARAKLLTLEDLDSRQQYEWHHYFPVCFWNDRSRNNKTVPLTLREHWVAHRLLFKIFPSKGMGAALVCMSKRDPKMNSRKFEEIKRQVAGHNWAKTEEGRAFLSEQARLRWQQGGYDTEKAKNAWSLHCKKLQIQWKEEGSHPLSSERARLASSERAKKRNKEMNAWLNKVKGSVERTCEKCGATIKGGLGNMKQHQRGRKCAGGSHA